MLAKKKRHIIRHFYVGIVILLFLLVLVAIFPKVDILTYNFLSPIKSSYIIAIMKFISFLGNFEFILVISAVLIIYLLYHKKKKEINFYVSSVVGGELLVYVLKHVIGRERPLSFLSSGLTDYSFPSGHAFVSLVAYGAMALLLRYKNEKMSDYIFIIPLLIGISRIFLGVHWLSDVLAGFFLGAIWLLACAKFFLMKK